MSPPVPDDLNNGLPEPSKFPPMPARTKGCGSAIDRYDMYGRLLEGNEPDSKAHFVRFDAYLDVAECLREMLKETNGDDEAERAAARKLLGLREGWPHKLLSGSIDQARDKSKDDFVTAPPKGVES